LCPRNSEIFDDQKATLRRFADHLVDGGALLLTVGPDASEVVGHVGGEPVCHASLTPEEYASVLAALGLSIVSFVPDDPVCDYASVLLATKAKTAS